MCRLVLENCHHKKENTQQNVTVLQSKILYCLTVLLFFYQRRTRQTTLRNKRTKVDKVCCWHFLKTSKKMLSRKEIFLKRCQFECLSVILWEIGQTLPPSPTYSYSLSALNNCSSYCLSISSQISDFAQEAYFFKAAVRCSSGCWSFHLSYSNNFSHRWREKQSRASQWEWHHLQSHVADHIHARMCKKYWKLPRRR